MLNLRGFLTSPSTETVQGETAEILRVFRGIGLVGAEFVEIIVVRDVIVGSLLFGGAEGAFRRDVEFAGGKRFVSGRS